MSSFAQVLQSKRKEMGLTQAKLAEYVGVAQHYITYLEKGERKPSNQVVQKLAELFSMPVSELLALANPELKADLQGLQAVTKSMPKVLLDLKNDVELRKNNNISDQDIEMLNSIEARGAIRSKDDYVFLLMTLRRLYQ